VKEFEHQQIAKLFSQITYESPTRAYESTTSSDVPFPVKSCRRLEYQYLRPVQPRAPRWWLDASKRFMRGAANYSPLMHHSLRNSRLAKRHKQTKMGAIDDSWSSNRSTETEFKRN